MSRPRPPLRDAYPELFRLLGGEPVQSPEWREVWKDFLFFGAPMIVILVPLILVLHIPLFSLEFAALVGGGALITRVGTAIRHRRQARRPRDSSSTG